jgi:DNA-directed RNA polymerase III subunit RPC1
MTLKTFHFAGISSMNITQGVPRINEIINCTKNITTPIITIKLNHTHSTKEGAIIVKNSVEKLVLGKILKTITETIGASECQLRLLMNLKKMQ